MKLQYDVWIDAPAERVWAVVGERFHHIAEWAAPIVSSCASQREDSIDELGVGTVRACTIAPFGPVRAGVVNERIIEFDRAGRTFEYEAAAGLPGFIDRATNRWSVIAIDNGHSHVCIRATPFSRRPVFGRRSPRCSSKTTRCARCGA